VSPLHWLSLSLSVRHCQVDPAPSRSHVSATVFPSLSLSLSLAATWGPTVNPHGFFPILASSVPAQDAGANSGLRRAKDLRSGRLGPPHPSPSAGRCVVMPGPSGVSTSFVRAAVCRQPRQSNPFPSGFLCRRCLSRLPLGARSSRVAAVAEPHYHVTQDKRAKTRPLHEPFPPHSLHTAGAVCCTLLAASLAAVCGEHVRPTQPRFARPCDAPTQSPHFALPRVRVRVHWRRPPLHPMPRTAATSRSSTSGKSAALHALHAQLALPLFATLRWHSCLTARMHAPAPSLRSRARLRSAAPSTTPMPSRPIRGTASAGIKGLPLPLARTPHHQSSSSSKCRLLPCFLPFCAVTVVVDSSP
jgi:hypothetical protein